MIWLLLAPFFVLIPYLGDVLYSPGSGYTDLAISHLPNALFLRESLLQWHQFPLWSPTILSGYPFAADPLSGLWYPPGWLVLLRPDALGFNLVIILHLLWGGLGMYLFLRAMKLAPPAAILGAIIFESLPKTIAHVAAGHITLVYAVSWTPWLLYAERRRFLSVMRGKINFLPGIILGMILLADVRWGFYAGVLWLVYSLAQGRIWVDEPDEAETSRKFGEKVGRYFKILRQFSFQALGQILISAGLAAPLLLALAQYTSLSTRAGLTPSESFTLSLPPARLLGLFFPDTAGTAEWVVYPSAAALILAIYAVINTKTRSRASLWIGTGVVSLILALGSSIPLMSNLAYLPGFSLLRVPPRALFITGLSLAILAAFGMDELLSWINKKNSSSGKAVNLVFTGLTVFAWVLTAGVYFVSGAVPVNMLWGSLMIALISIGVSLRQQNCIPTNWFAAGILILCLVDLGFADRSAVDPRSSFIAPEESASVFEYLKAQGGVFRVYSPSYSLRQPAASSSGLQLADGIDPLQLESYAKYMEKATGIPGSGYSVTLPPFPNGDPAQDNRDYLPDAQMLGRLNVKFVVSGYDLNQVGLKLLARFGDTHLYENQEVMPRAWVEGEGTSSSIRVNQAQILAYTPNRISIQAQGPGRLVLSEIAYPGWQVWVDGKPAEVLTIDGLLRGVTLSEGTHQVTFVFRPLLVYLGMGLAIFTWIGLGVLMIARWKNTP